MDNHITQTEQYNYRVQQRELSDITNSNITTFKIRFSDLIMTTVNYMNV